MISNMDLKHRNYYQKMHYFKVQVFFPPKMELLLTDGNLGYFTHYLIHIFFQPFNNYQRSSIKSIILSGMEEKHCLNL